MRINPLSTADLEESSDEEYFSDESDDDARLTKSEKIPGQLGQYGRIDTGKLYQNTTLISPPVTIQPPPDLGGDPTKSLSSSSLELDDFVPQVNFYRSTPHYGILLFVSHFDGRIIGLFFKLGIRFINDTETVIHFPLFARTLLHVETGLWGKSTIRVSRESTLFGDIL